MEANFVADNCNIYSSTRPEVMWAIQGITISQQEEMTLSKKSGLHLASIDM